MPHILAARGRHATVTFDGETVTIHDGYGPRSFPITTVSDIDIVAPWWWLVLGQMSFRAGRSYVYVRFTRKEAPDFATMAATLNQSLFV